MTSSNLSEASVSVGKPATSSQDIAIIGMAGRFPGARNIDEFWENLIRGEESIRRLSDEELLRAGVPRHEFEHPDYVKACPVLDDIDKFDASFFGLSPRDASVMDPAHRFFLEVSWQALENSGNSGLAEEGRVGVFAGSGAPLYWMNNVRTHRDIMESMGEFLVRHTGNDMNFLSTRTSYDLDLRGPSINVQTACSSALVAAHLARQSLLSGECDMALVGGSTIIVPMGQGYHYKEGEILSPDGHCRPFDHRSAGTVFGSGTACLVLKRLDDALDNGDTIHAVIKGSAINNDGAVKVGYLAPGVEGQIGVIRQALAVSHTHARNISYVETHGTGTSVGDPIELTALEQAFSEQTADKQYCGIGSVKSNIGHLGEAAAAASLIKVALALKHRLLPASLGYERPNPRFAIEDSPFFVNAGLTKWESQKPLLAGINALGAGGTNCHLILSEPPAALPGEGGKNRQLLVLSAKSKAALDRMSANLATHLEKHPTDDLADVAYTLAMGRRALTHRRVVVAENHKEAITLLRTSSPNRVHTTIADTSEPELVFTFPGGGAQYARMCFDLYETEPVYREALDACLAITDKEIGVEIRGLLFSPQEQAEEATIKLQRPTLALPILFSVEYALARLFESYGLRASAYIGHSMGEYVAACLAGVFSLRDGIRLVYLRGRLFETTKQGRMIGISLSEAETRNLMPAGLSIAAVNAPELCVASGSSAEIETFSQLLTSKEIDWTPIHIDVAAHSSLLDPILVEFSTFCKTIEFSAPTRPIASNLTGQWLTAQEATDPSYWVQHLRNTVRFSDCVETALQSGNRVFLEVGPGRTLTTLVGAQKTKVQLAFNTVRHIKEIAHDANFALLTMGKAWAAGAHVDWTSLYDHQIRNRIALPGYPFEAQSYWIEPKKIESKEDSLDLVKRDDMNKWFSLPVWEPTPNSSPLANSVKRWLLIAQDKVIATRLASEIVKNSNPASEVLTACHGPNLSRLDPLNFQLKTNSLEQVSELLEILKLDDQHPDHVVFISEAKGATNHTDRLETDFFAPLHISQALTAVFDNCAFTLVTHNAFSIHGESVDPSARLNLGPALVLPREWPDFPTRLIDLDSTDSNSAAFECRIQQLARELVSSDTASPVALRTPTRWVQHIRPTALPLPETKPDWLMVDDVVLVTGGLGGIGLVLAKHLANKQKIRLVLLSREGLAPRSDWLELLNNPDTPAVLRERITGVKGIESLGSQVLCISGDVTSLESLKQVISEIHKAFGRISVVIHAAGIMDDGPLQTKSDEQMYRVLAPKVLGANNLDACITEDLKAFILMSSVASFLGLPGQVDYTAANAFLDAFADHRQKHKPGRTLAINWNAWRDVGMVVNVDRSSSLSPLPLGKTTHPWLQASETTSSGRRYLTDFSIASHWLLAEHQIVGADALIPGTGLVELARAAYVDAVQHQSTTVVLNPAIEMRQVNFLSPFQVAPGKHRRLQIDLEWLQAGDCRITLTSSINGEVHMTATVGPSNQKSGYLSLPELLLRCPSIEETRNGFLDQDFVHFGPRWKNINSIRLGAREAVIQLTLEPTYTADLAVFQFHPALLDMATGAAQVLIPGFKKGQDFFVPFGYDQIRIFSPITTSITSHVRLQATTVTDLAVFDVNIFDSSGNEIIAITGFNMKRVNSNAAITQKVTSHEAKQNPAMAAILREAITRDEGVIAFDRALSQSEMPQIVASSVDVNAWLKKLKLDSQRLSDSSADDVTSGFSRPEMDSDYVKPEGVLETELSLIWSKLLGVTTIGVMDDFFELGGNSLIAVRFFARIKKDFGTSLPLSTLFAAPTIRLLAQSMRDQGYVESTQQSRSQSKPTQTTPTSDTSESSSLPVAQFSQSALQASPPLLIRPGNKGLPLFFVHDGLGEVLLYRTLAHLLKPGYPVYGLEPEISGGQFKHTRIVDMARAKIERIRTIQPHGPYLIAGLCAGGVVAFEMARQLQDSGEKTCFVGLIDASDVAAEERPLRIAQNRLNHLLEAFKPPKDQSIVTHVLGLIPVMLGKVIHVIQYEVSIRLQRMKNARKVDSLRQQSNHSSSVEPTISFLKLYEIAHREHIAKGQFSEGYVALFRATQGDGTVGDQPFREIYTDPLLGWQQRVREPVHVTDVPGGHSSLLQEPHVTILAQELQRHIDAALVTASEETTRFVATGSPAQP